MERRRFQLLILAVLFALGLIQIWYFFPQLPDKVASHFDLSGWPNGWSSKVHFALFSAGLNVFLALVFGGVSMVIPRLPESLINLPYKDYWLAPSRKQETLDKMSQYLLLIGNFTVTLLLLINQNIINFNIRRTDQPLTGITYLLTFYILAIMSIVIRMLIKYYKKPGDAGAH